MVPESTSLDRSMCEHVRKRPCTKIDTTENISFLQLLWRAVKMIKGPVNGGWFKSVHLSGPDCGEVGMYLCNNGI